MSRRKTLNPKIIPKRGKTKVLFTYKPDKSEGPESPLGIIVEFVSSSSGPVASVVVHIPVSTKDI